jgi:hypothetical protein
MKKVIMVFLMVAAILLFGQSAIAEKRLDVILMSNGYPSGAHENLNIHGKAPGENGTFSCATSDGGRSIFIGEEGESTIEYVWNKKAASVTELTVLDSCAEPFDGNAARVQLPYEQEGYYVFYRLRGKPNNGNPGGPSSIMLIPNPVLKVCNDTDPANPDFPDYTNCPDGTETTLMALGLVTNAGVYEVREAGLFRFDDSQESKGKGKGNGNSKAVDITGLFQWSGFVCDGSLDTNGDGVLNEDDVPEEYGNGDGTITEVEFESWLQAQDGMCQYHDDEWVWNLADLVVQSQTIDNDGAKLLKIRWYPVATTTYH